MHHKEDNALWYDASSTMPFQRDSWFHLLLYIVRYITLIQFELPVALMLRGRYRATGVMLAGYGTWFAVTWYGMKVMPFTAGYGLLVPFIILSVAAMRGNNLQHIFVSPDEPDCDFKLCYDIVNDPSNCGKFFGQLPRRAPRLPGDPLVGLAPKVYRVSPQAPGPGQFYL